MAPLTARLGIKGPRTVPVTSWAMTWHRKVRGNLRTIAKAMRFIRPLVFMPTPSVKAESSNHQVDDANVENVAPTEMPATTTKSTAITTAVTNSGRTPVIHHTIAMIRMPSTAVA